MASHRPSPTLTPTPPLPLDCQENDFNGWPVEELPVKEHLDDEWRNTVHDKCTNDDEPVMPNVPRVPGGERTTACPSMYSDDSVDHHNDCDAMEVEAPSNDATEVGDGTQAEGIVGRTKQQYSTLFLAHFVNNIMDTQFPGVTRQTTLSRMETPILLCGSAVAIIDVKLNDVLFGGVHDAQSLSRHDGNKRMFTLVKNVLISNPTTGAKKTAVMILRLLLTH